MDRQGGLGQSLSGTAWWDRVGLGKAGKDRQGTFQCGMVQTGRARQAVRNPETRLQCAVVDFMRATCPDCLTWHVANGGKRTPETARLMKRLGVLPGIFDLVVMAPGPFLGFMEVKVGNETLSENQEWFRTELIKMGFQYAVVRSLDDVKEAIIQWRLPNRIAK